MSEINYKSEIEYTFNVEESNSFIINKGTTYSVKYKIDDGLDKIENVQSEYGENEFSVSYTESSSISKSYLIFYNRKEDNDQMIINKYIKGLFYYVNDQEVGYITVSEDGAYSWSGASSPKIYDKNTITVELSTIGSSTDFTYEIKTDPYTKGATDSYIWTLWENDVAYTKKELLSLSASEVLCLYSPW